MTGGGNRVRVRIARLLAVRPVHGAVYLLNRLFEALQLFAAQFNAVVVR